MLYYVTLLFNLYCYNHWQISNYVCLQLDKKLPMDGFYSCTEKNGYWISNRRYSSIISRYWNAELKFFFSIYKILPRSNIWYSSTTFQILKHKVSAHGKNSSIKFIELFKNWGYRYLKNRVLENWKNFSE